MLARLQSRSSRARPRSAFLPTSHTNSPSLSRLVSRRPLSSTTTPPPSSRLRRYAVRTAVAAFGLGVAYELDKELHASAIIRNLRTLWTVSTPSSLYTPHPPPSRARLGRRLFRSIVLSLITPGGSTGSPTGTLIQFAPSISTTSSINTCGSIFGSRTSPLPRFDRQSRRLCPHSYSPSSYSSSPASSVPSLH